MSPASDSGQAADHASIAEWLATWGGQVARRDYAAARTLFTPEVKSFGTYMDTVEGLDALEKRQWRAIWPTIEGFRFRLETLAVFVSRDRLAATAMVVWDSIGFDESGTRFPRPGRTTVAVRRERLDAPWRGLHTHFSEFPRERRSSFGSEA